MVWEGVLSGSNFSWVTAPWALGRVGMLEGFASFWASMVRNKPALLDLKYRLTELSPQKETSHPLRWNSKCHFHETSLTPTVQSLLSVFLTSVAPNLHFTCVHNTFKTVYWLCFDLTPLLTVSCLRTIMMSYLFCVPDLAPCLAHNRCSVNIWHTHKQAREVICLTLVSWKWLIFWQSVTKFCKDSLIPALVFTHLLSSAFPSIHPSLCPTLTEILPCSCINHYGY